MIDFKKYTEFVNAVTSEESKYGGHFQDRLRDLYSNDFKTHRALTAALGLCAESGEFKTPAQVGLTQQYNILPEFVDHLMTYIDVAALQPLKLLVNAGNGAAGHVIDELEMRFQALNAPVEFIKINHEADGNFPNGIPNPILLENQAVTSEAVLAHGADLGIAWDGDFDRCFLFDQNGQFIEGYYIVGMLAEAFLNKSSNQ